MVTADRFDSTNTAGTPDAVHLDTTTVHLVPDAAGHLQAVLPPHGIAAWSWR